MRSLRLLPPLLVALALLLLAGGAVLVDGRQATPSADGTPAASELPGVTSEVLGRTEAVGAPGQELALARVTIAPGAGIPPHEHPGTQLAVIVAGELTYTVLTDEVTWTRPGGNAATPATTEAIVGGQTVVLRPGDSVVETPGAIHRAANEGDEPVVILLSTLFTAGQPRTLYVATPAPPS